MTVCLRARERLTGPVGLRELRCARAVFVNHDSGGKLKGTLTVHVDDGLLFGTRSDSIYRQVTELINTHFDLEG